MGIDSDHMLHASSPAEVAADGRVQGLFWVDVGHFESKSEAEITEKIKSEVTETKNE